MPPASHTHVRDTPRTCGTRPPRRRSLRALHHRQGRPLRGRLHAPSAPLTRSTRRHLRFRLLQRRRGRELRCLKVLRAFLADRRRCRAGHPSRTLALRRRFQGGREAVAKGRSRADAPGDRDLDRKAGRPLSPTAARIEPARLRVRNHPRVGHRSVGSRTRGRVSPFAFCRTLSRGRAWRATSRTCIA